MPIYVLPWIQVNGAFALEIFVKLKKGSSSELEKRLAFFTCEFYHKLDDAFYHGLSKKSKNSRTDYLTCPAEIGLCIMHGKISSASYTEIGEVLQEAIIDLQQSISGSNKDYAKSSRIIICKLLYLFYFMKTYYKTKRLRFDWRDCIVICVEFYNALDLELSLRSSILKSEVYEIFTNIFCHYNSVRLETLVVRIKPIETQHQ